METWLLPSVDDVEISPNNFTVFRTDRVQTHRGGGIALYIKSSLKPVRLRVDIEVSPCVEMICYRISTFSFSNHHNCCLQKRQLNYFRRFTCPPRNSTCGHAPGECLIVGDFYAVAVDWSNRACPKSDGLTRFRIGTSRQCWILCLSNSLTKSQQSDHREIVITLYYPSNLVTLIDMRPHVQELNGFTMSE